MDGSTITLPEMARPDLTIPAIAELGGISKSTVSTLLRAHPLAVRSRSDVLRWLEGLPRCHCGKVAGASGYCSNVHARQAPAPPGLMDVDHVAERFICTRSNVATLVQRGELKPVRIRGRVFFRPTEVERYEASRATLTLVDAAKLFGLPLNGLRYEVFESRRIPAIHLGRHGQGCQLDKAVLRAVLRRHPGFERCPVDGCGRPLLGASGGCGVRGHWRTGRPRPDCQKYPGQASEERSCEDCGESLGIVKAHRIVEIPELVCASCSTRRQWAAPHEGLERWLQGTVAYRQRVADALQQFADGKTLLSTAQFAELVGRTPSVVTAYVNAGLIAAERVRWDGTALVPATYGDGSSPTWLFYEEAQAKTFLRVWARANGGLVDGNGRRASALDLTHETNRLRARYPHASLASIDALEKRVLTRQRSRQHLKGRKPAAAPPAHHLAWLKTFNDLYDYHERQCSAGQAAGIPSPWQLCREVANEHSLDGGDNAVARVYKAIKPLQTATN